MATLRRCPPLQLLRPWLPLRPLLIRSRTWGDRPSIANKQTSKNRQTNSSKTHYKYQRKACGRQGTRSTADGATNTSKASTHTHTSTHIPTQAHTYTHRQTYTHTYTHKQAKQPENKANCTYRRWDGGCSAVVAVQKPRNVPKQHTHVLLLNAGPYKMVVEQKYRMTHLQRDEIKGWLSGNER